MKQALRRLPTARREQIAIAGLFVMLFCAVTLRAAQAAPVPEFSLQLFDGKSISLRDYRGKPILVNFFHSK
jgi:cytochrome oxidase Cu insertion factor (SCO1/SenC/PrrC family)